MNEQLKPCPFCGHEAMLFRSWSDKTRRYFAYVKCDLCGGQGRTISIRREEADHWENSPAVGKAISAWNMRDGDPHA